MNEDRWAKLEEVLDRKLGELEERIVARLQKSQKPKIEIVNGRFVGITPEQKEAWAAAYGAVDVESELRRAAAWCVSNPSLSPKSQVGRFLNTWFARQQNQNSLRSIPGGKATSGSPHRPCDYCGKTWVGQTNGFYYCSDHQRNAMDREKPMKLAI